MIAKEWKILKEMKSKSQKFDFGGLKRKYPNGPAFRPPFFCRVHPNCIRFLREHHICMVLCRCDYVTKTTITYKIITNQKEYDLTNFI